MAVKKKGLGRGLNGMLGVDLPKDNAAPVKEPAKNVSRETISPAVGQEQMISLREIEPNAGQPRKDFDEAALKELADSIRQYGVIEPILVQKKGKGYEIIAGERRWRAARLAGLKKIPVLIREYSDREVMEISLIENLQREDLNPMEEAMAYHRLMTDFNLKQKDIAEKVSKNHSTIANAIRLLRLDPRVQALVAQGKLSAGQARPLLGLEDADIQYLAAEKIAEHQMSAREVERYVKQLSAPAKPKKAAEEEGVALTYRNLENRLKERLGSKVAIKRGADGKGKIEIDYYSMDELERLCDLFLGN
ncbi:MAG: ParB/RepB/Spo0J family partition protein [Lachnospiraceae bacterium]|nr:ParB/RepB/Spo0J family partition protein [Lachnospiraceae bacterium]MBQ9594041.1 ParB/RepB/Spo0J family partition protein [Lachnospiraceae bacterium]